MFSGSILSWIYDAFVENPLSYLFAYLTVDLWEFVAIYWIK